jgi:hypothetical protein
MRYDGAGIGDIDPGVFTPGSRHKLDLAPPLRDIGGFMVSDAAKSVPVEIPSGAEFFYAFADAADAHLNFDSEAESTSSLVVFDGIPLVMYPVSSKRTLNCYCNTGGVCYFRFLGR